MKFLSTLIKHSLQPAMQSETFNNAPLVNPVPHRHQLNSIEDSMPGDPAPLKQTHGTIQQESTRENVEQSITSNTPQHQTDRQNTFQASVSTERSATIEDADHIDNTTPISTGIPSCETPPAPETTSAATDTPVFNPESTRPEQALKEHNSEHKARRKQQVQTQTISIEKTDTFNAPWQSTESEKPVSTNDPAQNSQRPNLLNNPQIHESKTIIQHSVVPPEDASAIPTRIERVPANEDFQHNRQLSENISPATSVMPSESSGGQTPTVEHVTTSTPPPPQVRIGHINVLVEDQAAAPKPRKSATAKTSAPSIPFGIRGL